MAEMHNFRTAFRGFDRQDVVQYIEMINARHSAQIAQLNTQLKTARDELAQVTAAPAQDNNLQEQLDAANARIAELEAQLTSAPVKTNEELEAYRRAERVEREATDRAQNIYRQLNTLLGDATSQTNFAVSNLDSITEQVNNQLAELRNSLLSNQSYLEKTAADLLAMQPSQNIE